MNADSLREKLRSAGWLSTKQLTDLLQENDVHVCQGSVCNTIKEMTSKKIKVRMANKDGTMCNRTKRTIDVSDPESVSRIMAMAFRVTSSEREETEYIICRNGLEYRNDIMGKIAIESTEVVSRPIADMKIHLFNGNYM